MSSNRVQLRALPRSGGARVAFAALPERSIGAGAGQSLVKVGLAFVEKAGPL
jgi:hypothetical protein